jgi:hypothetical protein
MSEAPWWKWKPLDPSWLNQLNTPTYKTVWAVWCCIGTFMVWGACTLFEVHVEEVAFGLWLGFLAAWMGINYKTYATTRDTDYGALERKADIERAKAGLPAGPTAEMPVAK